LEIQLPLSFTLAQMKDFTGVTLFASGAEIMCKPAALPGDMFIVPVGAHCIQTLCKHTMGNKAGSSP